MEPKELSRASTTTRTSRESQTQNRPEFNPWFLDATLAFMILSFILGIISAIGHHIFNLHWDGVDVATASWSQTWTNRAGTAFAFLTKMFFVFATGVAFVQQFWVTITHRPLSVRKVDAIFDVLNNGLAFLDLGLWLKLPFLAVIAIVAWLLPLAAVVTPGTLTVASIPQTNIISKHVPEIDFPAINTTISDSFDVDGHDLINLQRIAMTAGAQGDVLQLPSVYPNASYRLDFFGPAVSCKEIEDENDVRILTRIFNFTAISHQYYYFAFVPRAFELAETVNKTLTDKQFFLVDEWSEDASSIYVTRRVNLTYNLGIGPLSLAKCSLYNASYSAKFDFAYPSQQIQLTNRRLYQGITAIANVSGIQADIYAAYLYIMQAYARLLVGYTDSGLFNGGENGLFGSVSSPNGQSLYTLTTLGLITKDQVHSEWISSLESMFHNVTLSTLSNGLWLKNSEQAEPVPVRVARFVNIYRYSSLDLYIAYGIAILLTLLCVLVGLLAAIRNGGHSYSNTFSTVLRTTRDRSLDSVIFTFDDTVGANPLDDDIGELQLLMIRDSDSFKSGFERID